MSWQTELKKATFGGVEFKVDTADLAFGRDVSTSEAQSGGFKTKQDLDESQLSKDQKSKKTFFEGGVAGSGSWITKNIPLPRVFTVVAHFSGLDYIDTRNKFINKIEEGRSLPLQLPTFDEINVYAGKAIVRYNNREGGYETIQVTFTQDQKQIQPKQRANTLGEALEQVDTSKQSFLAAFGTKLESGAQWVAEEATKLTEDVSLFVNDTLGVGAIGDGLEAVTNLSNQLAQNATELIYTPTVLADQINDTISALTFAFEQPINAFNAQLQLLENYGVIDNSVGATPTEQDAIDNNNSFVQIVNNTALAEAGRAAVLAEYDSLDDALKTKSRFEAAARAQQLQNGNAGGSDESYREISNIIALVSNHIIAQEDLPSNVDIEYPDSNTALSLAHDLYADSNRADEIVARNNVENPLFLPKELTVLSF